MWIWFWWIRIHFCKQATCINAPTKCCYNQCFGIWSWQDDLRNPIYWFASYSQVLACKGHQGKIVWKYIERLHITTSILWSIEVSLFALFWLWIIQLDKYQGLHKIGVYSICLSNRWISTSFLYASGTVRTQYSLPSKWDDWREH